MEAEAINYRTLSREGIGQLAQIDRTESIEGFYRARDGELVLEEAHWEEPDWSAESKAERIAALQEECDRGATFFGALEGSTLVGMAALNHAPLPSGAGRLELSGLWVSHHYRGRGIGSALVQLVKEEARERGAQALYVSATPTENTVRFYRSVGFRLTNEVDPDLYEKEPEDIHMELSLE